MVLGTSWKINVQVVLWINTIWRIAIKIVLPEVLSSNNMGYIDITPGVKGPINYSNKPGLFILLLFS